MPNEILNPNSKLGQQKNKFDTETIKKIVKGCWIASEYALGQVLAAAIDYILNSLLNVDFGKWTPIIGVIIPLIKNIIVQYRKGK